MDKEEVESDGMKIAGLICKNFNSGYSRPGQICHYKNTLKKKIKL